MSLRERATYTGDEGVEATKGKGPVLVNLDDHFAAMRACKASEPQGSARGRRNDVLSVTEESE